MDYFRISGLNIRYQLINLPQLVFEVTDDCNLNCYYCSYGQLYTGYDKRLAKYLRFEDVEPLLDFLKKLWATNLSAAKCPITHIGFYGGEPLLNMPFIKAIVDYFDSMSGLSRQFKYSLTTNAVLLDKYCDYLVGKDFSLLFSLDGDQFGNSYRVNKDGRNSFDIVTKNIKGLQQSYPDFFPRMLVLFPYYMIEMEYSNLLITYTTLLVMR